MSAIQMGTKFPVELEREIFNKVRGKSSVAAMADAEPIPFTGKEVFTFDFDSDVSVVGEGGNKPAGDAKAEPVIIRPVKVVYQSRVTNEFMYAAEEERMNILKEFGDGFARKIAAGLDKMSLHGVNPATGLKATGTIANNYMDYVVANYATGANVIAYNGTTDDPVAKINAAIAKIDDPNGIILG